MRFSPVPSRRGSCTASASHQSRSAGSPVSLAPTGATSAVDSGSHSPPCRTSLTRPASAGPNSLDIQPPRADPHLRKVRKPSHRTHPPARGSSCRLASWESSASPIPAEAQQVNQAPSSSLPKLSPNMTRIPRNSQSASSVTRDTGHGNAGNGHPGRTAANDIDLKLRTAAPISARAPQPALPRRHRERRTSRVTGHADRSASAAAVSHPSTARTPGCPAGSIRR